VKHTKEAVELARCAIAYADDGHRGSCIMFKMRGQPCNCGYGPLEDALHEFFGHGRLREYPAALDAMKAALQPSPVAPGEPDPRD